MVGDRTWVGCSIRLSDGLTADPFGLIHHFACMRQTAHVPHFHQQVASRFQDVNCLIMGDDDKALSVDFQDLVTNLKHTRIIKARSIRGLLTSKVRFIMVSNVALCLRVRVPSSWALEA